MPFARDSICSSSHHHSVSESLLEASALSLLSSPGYLGGGSASLEVGTALLLPSRSSLLRPSTRSKSSLPLLCSCCSPPSAGSLTTSTALLSVISLFPLISPLLLSSSSPNNGASGKCSLLL